MRAQFHQQIVEIGFLLIEPVDDDHLRNPVLRRRLPGRIRAHAHAVARVHHHQRKVTHAQRTQPFTEKIRVTRAVYDIELLAQPFAVQQRRLHRDLPLGLASVIIRNGRACGDGCPCD